ncbi:MAG: hypothetical protein WC637_02210 [Victivallales bacterium]
MQRGMDTAQCGWGIATCVLSGDLIYAFGIGLEARGLWTYNMENMKGFDFRGQTPQIGT